MPSHPVHAGAVGLGLQDIWQPRLCNIWKTKSLPPKVGLSRSGIWLLLGQGLGGSNLSLLCFCNCVGAFAGAVLAEVLTIWEGYILLGGKTGKVVTSVKPPAHLSCQKCTVTKLKHALVSDAVGLHCLEKGPLCTVACATAPVQSRRAQV